MFLKSVKIELDGGNAAMSTREDIVYALSKVITRISWGDDSFTARDINGNIIGDVTITWDTCLSCKPGEFQGEGECLCDDVPGEVIMYAEVDVIVDGAMEESACFGDETLMREYVSEIRDEAEGDGYRTEVYVYFHEHSVDTDGEDCSCSQYETDHRPKYIFNGEADEKGVWQ